MADGSTTSHKHHAEPEEGSQLQGERYQLRYPTIDLTTSLDSLLTFSYPSSQASTIMPPAVDPTPALDESWASLGTSDFSREDDLQSETTDAESLVDLSSTQDTESVIEEDESSEHGAEEAEQLSMVTTSAVAKAVEPVEIGEQEQHLEEAMDDTIILRPSEDQPNRTWTHLEYVCAATNMNSISPSPTGLHETNQPTLIHMNVSNESLSTSNKPFRIAYYGIGAARVSREELLGKIGAVLVASATKHEVNECYNILPTEFGPGSKPAFAELIPSQAQMAVYNITILKHTPDRPKSIRFASKQGMVFESKPAVSACSSNREEEERPDLLVVQLCRDDLADDFYTAKQLIELAKRHCWPALVVSQDSSAGLYPILCPHSLFKKTEIQTLEGPRTVKHPIDLDSFLRIDTDQLNKHIGYIISMAEMRQRAMQPPTTLATQLRNRAFRFLRTPASAAQLDRYVLEKVEPSEKSVAQRAEHTLFKELRQFFLGIDHQKLLRDAVGSFAVMLVGLLLVFIYQNLPGRFWKMQGHLSGGSALSNPTSLTTTVTATSALPLTSTAPSTLSDESAVGSFDHMLHRLIGKAKVEEVELPEDIPSTPTPTEHAASLDVRQETRVGVANKVESFLSNLAAKVDSAQDRINESGKKFKSRRRAAREHNRQEIQDMHVKLQRFWDDTLKGVHELGEHSHDSFAKLVAQSQKLLAQSRKAGGKRLEKLVQDQKALLLKAQKQAQNIAELPKKPTKQRTLLNRAREVFVD
ncbi:hypothetical protein H2198_001141 [Neophaeococcomyces mojaviensis]|uniref:Uncharacterized protein n=1 Tax=Neophaeococcomyces mojaviensis TaxID=3383035 RepID=A0ACC3AIG4_9EURO|nr:hypothetical protein H2198_001141 [Knufia sp. JES_112]